MKTIKMFTLLALLAFAGFGCDKQQEAPKTDEPTKEATAPTEEEPAEEATQAEEAPADKVELTAAGNKFDPPIKPEQLPDGAWYCDMGTVHWAATEKTEDGKCPLCGMALKEYSSAGHAEAKEKAVEAKDDHGHEHGDGEHGDEMHGEDGHEH